EGFIQFDYINIGKLKTCHLKRFRNSKNWTESHFFRLVSHSREGDVASQRPNAQSLSAVGRHHHSGSGSIGHLRRVACCYCSLGMKRWLEREQSFKGGVGTRAFVDFENYVLTLRLRTV